MEHSVSLMTPSSPSHRPLAAGGTNDIDDVCGNWRLANQELAAALRFRGYDAHFAGGCGFHSMAHGGATLPSALRWLWDPA